VDAAQQVCPAALHHLRDHPDAFHPAGGHQRLELRVRGPNLKRDDLDGTLWRCEATKAAGVPHVKLIVDAAVLPGHMGKKMADKTF
jgi:hypothetical protein